MEKSEKWDDIVILDWVNLKYLKLRKKTQKSKLIKKRDQSCSYWFNEIIKIIFVIKIAGS